MIDNKFFYKNADKDQYWYTYYDNFYNKIQKQVQNADELQECTAYYEYIYKLIKEEHILYGEARQNAYLKFKKTYYKRSSKGIYIDFTIDKQHSNINKALYTLLQNADIPW